jgi:hypothetical protein
MCGSGTCCCQLTQQQRSSTTTAGKQQLWLCCIKLLLLLLLAARQAPLPASAAPSAARSCRKQKNMTAGVAVVDTPYMQRMPGNQHFKGM